MENSPRKSKAFIITFILVLVVMLIGYYLFTNRNSIFGTQGSTSISKIFSPLLGTSKSKDVKVIDTSKNTDTNDISKRVGVVLTDEKGNKYVMAEAGENLKKGDVLYIAGFNSSNNPIVKKAIANDKTKSLVFGVAAEDMDMGKLGKVIIEGILEGVTTNKKEGTLWATGNPLYLSDKIAGGMTKNSPKSPSYIVPVGSVLKVDAINGSIRIGNIANNENINKKEVNNLGYLNSQLLGMSSADFIDYWNSIFNNDFNNGFGSGGGYFDQNNNYIPPVISVPTPEGNTLPLCSNKKDDDGDKLIDEKDPNCHLNGVITDKYISDHYSESSNPTISNNLDDEINKDNETTKTPENICKTIESNPLTFTNEERKTLDDLLRKYYILASTLKSENDIALAYGELSEYKNFIEQINNLTNQCYSQSIDKNGNINPSYKGPTKRYGNPWYKYNERGSYVTTPIYSYCKYVDSSNASSWGMSVNFGYWQNIGVSIDDVPYCEPSVGKNGDTRNDLYNIWGIPAFNSPVDLRDFESVLNVW